jgi:hypothetical protein
MDSMTTSIAAYPLAWPHMIARTEASRRVNSQFKTALDPALKNVTNSLRRFGEATGKKVDNIVISSNYTLGDRSPRDPGVAVWFLWDGAERCIAVDRYPRIEHNLQAIHHVLEARVTEARHGGLRIVQQTFTGFVALPPPSDQKHWWEVLGVRRSAAVDEIKAAHREKAKTAHPDMGGDAETMAELNAALEAALQEATVNA